jgi:hypothetical protein
MGTKGTIRPLERADLAAVASLYELVGRSGTRTAAPGLASHFEETIFDHPWADPDIPSLVYEQGNGAITGFMASYTRRFLFDGRPVRLSASGHLVVDPAVRRQAVGLFLLRRHLAGPQDISITDGAGEPTRRMWIALGGQESHLSCVSWFRPLRPVSAGLAVLAQPSSRTGRLPLGSSVAASARGVAARMPFRRAGRETESAPLSPEELAVCLSDVTGSLRLRPAYDRVFLEWLFATMAAVRSRGVLVARVVRRADGRATGWYVYYARRGGISDVLHVASSQRDAGVVLDDLLEHARSEGVALLRGRLEPHLLEAVGARQCILRYNGGALIHARDRELIGAVAAGDALLTRMDGELWMGHHLEPFGRP